MKLFLIKDVKNFGRVGEVKEVNPAYARNFLLPKGLAVYANDPKALEYYAKKIISKKEMVLQKEKDEQKINKLKNQIFIFKAKADKNGHLYGSIGPKEIALKIGINEDLIKTHFKELGIYDIVINFNDGYETLIKIEIKKEE